MKSKIKSAKNDKLKNAQRLAANCFPKMPNDATRLSTAPKLASEEFLHALCDLYFGSPRNFLGATTMSDLANELKLGKAANIRKLLIEAGKRGLVAVAMSPSLINHEALIKKTYGLQNVLLCDSANRGRDVRSALGRLAIDHLEETLDVHPNLHVGLGGGRTIHAMVSAAIAGQNPGNPNEQPMTVSPLSFFCRGERGSTQRGPLMDAPFLAMTLAWQLVCGIYISAIPSLPEIPKEALAFTEEQFRLSKSLQSAFAHACSADIFYTGASHLEEESHLVSLYKNVGISFEEMKKAGCVGHINFCPINAAGENLAASLLPKELQRKRRHYPLHCHPFLAAVDADLLKEKAATPGKKVVLVAGGAAKTPLIKAILAGGYVNELITDRDTAAKLVSASAAVS